MNATIETRRLTKSRTDRMIDGVCGGFAEYLGVDATLVRLGFVFLGFLGGLGILLYIVAMIVMPSGPPVASAPAQPAAGAKPRDNAQLWGIILVVLGGFWFLSNVGFSFWHHWWNIPWGAAIPLLLIGAGVAFLVSATNKPATTAPPAGATAGDSAGGATVAGEPQPATTASRAGTSRLFRSRTDKKLFGVCGGIGAYLNADPTIVRILFIIAGFASAGMMILLYIIMAIVVPYEPAEQKTA